MARYILGAATAITPVEAATKAEKVRKLPISGMVMCDVYLCVSNVWSSVESLQM